MSEATTGQIKNLGWRVTFAGTGINLALGVLYTWSIFASALEAKLGWSKADTADPFAVCTLVFAFAMILAGRLQDKISPKLAATVGGILVGTGMLVCAFAKGSYWPITIGFGVLVGAGIGFAYASATPPAIKWFPPRKVGLIAGIVVSGFGLASLYITPLAEWSISGAKLFGLDEVATTFLLFGAGFLALVVLLAQILKTPPAGYKPVDINAAKHAAKRPVIHGEEMGWKSMIRLPQFWMLWFMYMCGTGVGLMVINQAKLIVKEAAKEISMPLLASACVMLLAIGNGAGRIIAGFMSDKIGRSRTMFIVFLIQAIMLGLMIFLVGNPNAALFVVAFVSMGFNFGACLAVFPAATKDYFGLKNFGINYGCVFTAYGIGGFLFSTIAKLFVSGSAGNNYTGAFITGIAALVLAMILTFVTKPPRAKDAAAVESK